MPRSRRSVVSRALLLTVAIATTGACAAESDVAPAMLEPRLALVDSVALADSGALALGDLIHAGLHVADDAIWVGDRQNGRIVRFARDGRALGQAGRKGEGPGEMGGTGPLLPLGDGTVVAWDYTAAKLVAYDATDGAFRWETPVREQAFALQLQAVGDSIWFGVVSVAEHTGAMRVAARTGEMTRHAPVPAEYREGLNYAFPYSVALRMGDTLFVGYAGDHRVFLHHDSGRVDSLAVPARRRRGVPANLLAQVKEGLGRRTDEGLENLVSSLMRGARLADGSVVLLYYDVTFDQQAREPATADVWLTVLDPTFRRACVDALLPLAERTLPSIAFRGDTLFALEQLIRGERAMPVLRTFTISTAGCAWMPVVRAEAME